MFARLTHLARTAGLRQVLGNAFIVSLSNGILKASNAVLFVIVVHRLGKGAAGQFSIATSLIAVSFGLALFGLDEILMREAVQRERRAGLFANFLFARVILTALSALILDLGLVLSGLYPSDLTAMIVLLSLGQVGDGVLLLCQALYVSQARAPLVLLTTVTISAIRIILSLVILVLFPGRLLHVVIVFVVTSLLGAGLAVHIAVTRVLTLPGGAFLYLIDAPATVQRVKRSMSFFWIGVFVLVEFQADVILLSLLRTTDDVALYSAALTIILAAWIVPQSYRTAVYLRLAQAYRRSGAEFWHFVWLTAGGSLLIGAAFALALAFGGVILFDLLYPDDYNSSLPVLRILVLPVFFAFVSALSARALLTLHRERLAAWLVGGSMVVNVLSNLLLIPMFGALGAAWARGLSAGVFCVMSYAAVAAIYFGGRRAPGARSGERNDSANAPFTPS